MERERRIRDVRFRGGDALGVELGDLGRAQSEEAPEDVVVRLSEAGRRVSHGRLREREAPHEAWVGVDPGVGVVDVDEGSSGVKVRVGVELPVMEDARGRDAALLERVNGLELAQAAGPVGDARVELPPPLQALCQRKRGEVA